MSRKTLRTLFCLMAIVGGILTAVFLGDYVVKPGLSPRPEHRSRTSDTDWRRWARWVCAG